ncbi:hypothetical protein AB1N83_008719 [Pleurotus pulmonarius]
MLYTMKPDSIQILAIPSQSSRLQGTSSQSSSVDAPPYCSRCKNWNLFRRLSSSLVWERGETELCWHRTLVSTSVVVTPGGSLYGWLNQVAQNRVDLIITRDSVDKLCFSATSTARFHFHATLDILSVGSEMVEVRHLPDLRSLPEEQELARTRTLRGSTTPSLHSA